MQSAQATNQDLSHQPGPRPRPPKKLICIAWMIEIVAILVSLSLAIYPVVAAQDSLLNGWLGAAPFLVISAAEFSKIPLVEALFRIKGVLLSSLTLFAIAVICVNTFYTVSNGFERARNAKTKHIEDIKRNKIAAEREIGRIKEERARAERSRDLIKQQLADIAEREQKEVSAFWDWASKIADKKGLVARQGCSVLLTLTGMPGRDAG